MARLARRLAVLRIALLDPLFGVIEGAIAGATSVPSAYLWGALLYSALYCTAAMLLALVLFEDRDLA